MPITKPSLTKKLV